jgi:hypothetical protein
MLPGCLVRWVGAEREIPTSGCTGMHNSSLPPLSYRGAFSAEYLARNKLRTNRISAETKGTLSVPIPLSPQIIHVKAVQDRVPYDILIAVAMRVYRLLATAYARGNSSCLSVDLCRTCTQAKCSSLSVMLTYRSAVRRAPAHFCRILHCPIPNAVTGAAKIQPVSGTTRCGLHYCTAVPFETGKHHGHKVCLESKGLWRWFCDFQNYRVSALYQPSGILNN